MVSYSDVNVSETGVTWLLTGFLLSASVGTAIIGKLGDMYGKQRLLVWTLLVLAAAACAWRYIPESRVRSPGRVNWAAAASGMNTVLRTLGEALGGQIAATFVARTIVHGLPELTGFTKTFAMAALFLVCCLVAGLLIPVPAAAATVLSPAASQETI